MFSNSKCITICSFSPIIPLISSQLIHIVNLLPSITHTQRWQLWRGTLRIRNVLRPPLVHVAYGVMKPQTNGKQNPHKKGTQRTLNGIQNKELHKKGKIKTQSLLSGKHHCHFVDLKLKSRRRLRQRQRLSRGSGVDVNWETTDNAYLVCMDCMCLWRVF